MLRAFVYVFLILVMKVNSMNCGFFHQYRTVSYRKETIRTVAIFSFKFFHNTTLKKSRVLQTLLPSDVWLTAHRNSVWIRKTN